MDLSTPPSDPQHLESSPSAPAAEAPLNATKTSGSSFKAPSTPFARIQQLEKALDASNQENARLRRKIAFLTTGGAHTDDLRNRSICNITYQNISLECREEVEKTMYKISGSRDVLDTYHTWALKRGHNIAPLIRNGKRLDDFEIGPSESIDLSKRSGFSGSVQYFHDFTLDTSAWPSPDLNRMDVHLWSTPYYHVDSPTIIPENWRERIGGSKPSGAGPGGACFNCGQGGHALNACPKPKDQDRIRKAINEWKRSRIEDAEVRYHSVGPQTPDAKSLRTSSSIATPGTPAPRATPKPGVLSERLQNALGIGPNDMPPWYRNFVYYGYPPSYYRVPEGPVKFTWVDNAGEEVDSSTENKPKSRTRTVAYPNLAAPLHDLSLFFDLYHPVETPEETPNSSAPSIASPPPTAKYRVTTVIDGDQPFVAESSQMVVDLTNDGDDATTNGSQSHQDPFKTPARSTKKRAREAEDEDEVDGEVATKKRTLEPVEPDNEKEDDAEAWSDNLLNKLKKNKILLTTTSEAEEKKSDEDDLVVTPLIPADQVTLNLPHGDGSIRHGLSEQDLSTHGSVQQSTGIWQKLKNLLDDRKSS